MLKRLVAVFTTVLLAVGLTIGVASPASAHTPRVSENCETLTVNLTQYEGDKKNYVTVTIDGVKVEDRTRFGDSFKESYAWAPTTTSHTWKVEVDAHGSNYDETLTGTWIPCASTALTCDVSTLFKGSPLANGDHINMDVVINGTKRQVNASVDIRQTQDPKSESGLVLRVKLPSGDATLPLTNAQVKSGILAFEYSKGWTGSWTVEWVKYNSKEFNQNRNPANFLHCQKDTPVVIATAPSATTPTCDVDGTLVVPSTPNITWTGGANGDGPGTYTLVATPAAGYTLNGAQGSWIVQVLPKGTNLDCGPPPCIASNQVSYTYDPATNSGTVTVPNPVGSSGVLCDPFWVTAVSWKFVGEGVWPQSLHQNNPMPERNGEFRVDEPGTYAFAADVVCGQGDIYASYDAQPVPTAVLNGPNDPYAEHFLHDMGFTGPTPTYTQDSPGCNKATPVAPTVTAITECGTDGSVTWGTTTGVVYSLTSGSGTSGAYEVTATPAANYYFDGPQVVRFTGNLGARTDCAQPTEPAVTAAVCDVPTGVVTSAYLTVPSTPGLEYRIGTTVLTAGAKVDLPTGDTTVTVTALPGYTNTGATSYLLTVGDVVDCDDPVQYVAPTVTDEICDATTGDISDGALTFTQVEHLSYLVDGVTVVFPTGVTTVTIPVTTGTHTVRYQTDAGFYLAGTATLTEKSETVTVAAAGDCDDPVEYVAPTVTDEVCDVVVGGSTDGVVTFALVDHLTYVFDGDPVTAADLTIEKPAGSYSLVVTADDGYFIRGAGTSQTFTITVDAPSVDCDEVAIIPLDPFVASEECSVDPVTGDSLIVDGTITITYSEHVTWTISNDLDGIEKPVAVDTPGTHTFSYPAGDYHVHAYADAGYFITTPTSFPLTVREPAVLPCGLDTHAQLDTGASWTNQVCTVGGLVDPTITVEPFPGVTYFIDGVKVTSTTTTVAPGTYAITAVADDPSNTVTTPSWTPTLLAASTALCGDLTTLALTGETPGGWLILAAVLLLAGLALLAVRLLQARRTPGRHATA